MNSIKRLSWDTPMSELMHSDEIDLSQYDYIDLDEDEIMHWKYIKREKVNGKWRYYYDKDEMKNDVKGFFKETGDKISKAALTKVNKVTSNLNTYVSKARDLITKFYDDPNNIYNVTHQSYTEKLEKIKETQEWKDIVARKDSEYVKKNKDGTVTYDIDKYLVDKKHPVLDAIGDIMSGRNVDTLEVTGDSLVAGIKDYATSAIELGMLTIGFTVNGLVRKFQFSQGSYDDDIEELTERVEEGAEFVSAVYDDAKAMYETASTTKAVSNVADDVRNGRDVDMSEVSKAVSEVAGAAGYKVKAEDVEKLATMLSTAAKDANVSEAAKNINEGRIVEAAQLLMESDLMKETMGSSDYYKQAESVLSGLSEEEIQAVNLLIQQMRGG